MSSVKGTIPMGSEYKLMISFNLQYLEIASLNRATLQVKASVYEFGGNPNIQSIMHEEYFQCNIMGKSL